MKRFDINSLTLDNIGVAPLPVKAGITGFLCAMLLGAGWWFDTQYQQESLTQAEAKEAELLQTLRTKQTKAVNLEALKQQLQEIKDSAGEMLKRLPSKTEVAALLVDISQQGLSSGLEFELFKPGNEQPADFYMELPIQIRVTGDYHQFGKFVSGVSDLPRIVTQHDIHIQVNNKAAVTNAKDSKEQGHLVMDMLAKTYRYLDEQELAQTKVVKK